MNFVTRYLIRRHAQRDAESGIDTIEERITTRLGPRPQFDPVGNAQHGQIGRDLLKNTEAEEIQEDLNRVEDELLKHPHSSVLLAALVFLFVVEIFSCLLLLTSLGFINPERIILGLALAALVFFITGATVRISGRERREGVPRRSSAFYILNVSYVILIITLTQLRYEGFSSTETGTHASDLATAFLLLFISLGPAWAFEFAMRRREPVVYLTKEARTIRKRLRSFRRAYALAQRFVNDLARKSERWDREAATMRAQFQMEHIYRSQIHSQPDSLKKQTERKFLPIRTKT